MTEKPPAKAEMGPLLWPRFYGPSVERSRLFYDKYVKLTLTILASGLFLATGILLIWGGTDPRWGALNIAISIGIPVFYIYLERQARTSEEYEPMRDRGAFDWDLHGNGLLTREYADELPGRVRTAFVPWAGLTKAYLTVTDENARLVWDLAKSSVRKAQDAGGEFFPGPDFAWDDRARTMLSRFIWLVGRESGTADLRLDRDLLRDPERFSSILRQKLKEVE